MGQRTKELIDRLIALRTRGRASAEHFVRAHLVLAGIDPDTALDRPDDPEQLERLQRMIQDYRG